MKTSRRSAIAALAGAAVAPSAARSAPKATAFALIGDRYHNSDYIRTGLNRTIVKDLGISIDFCDETRMLTAETLTGYKLLIILRDGMIWPAGYPDENTNAAWVATGKPKLVSDPPVDIEPSPQSQPARAPKKITPGARVELSVLHRFLSSNQAARELVRRASDYDVNRIRFKNPFIPVLRFTLGTGLEIVSRHQRRHLVQAEQVKRSSDFQDKNRFNRPIDLA